MAKRANEDGVPQFPTLASKRSAHLSDAQTLHSAVLGRFLRFSCLARGVGCAALLIPRESHAHIKWFCAYDTAVPPLPLSEVITPIFTTVAVAFGLLMFLAYAIDAAIGGSKQVERIDNALLQWRGHIDPLLRATIGAFFVSLWTSGGIILTPELKSSNNVIPWIQLGIAASMLFRPTLIAGAAGIMGLYACGIARYGAFHMMDYPIFPGLAAYLVLTAMPDQRSRASSLPILYTSIALTMMWGAVEKFGYPAWTFPLLAAHRELTLGLNFDWFMVIAGFVEFSLAFFILTGTALLRLASLALLALLTSAVPEFGKIDAVGHALIITGLIVIIIAGQHSIQMPVLLCRHGVAARAGTMTLSYAGTMAGIFVLYYGAQYFAGR